MYTILPLGTSPRQVFTLDMEIDGEPFHALVELRYLWAPDCWVLSISDNASGELLVNRIPLICSLEQPNDLLRPFRHLREGRGLGSLLVIRAADEPATPDPAENTLSSFTILWGDTL